MNLRCLAPNCRYINLFLKVRAAKGEHGACGKVLWLSSLAATYILLIFTTFLRLRIWEVTLSSSRLLGTAIFMEIS